MANSVNWDWTGKNTFGIQVIDSSRSIGANIAEDYCRASSQNRERFAKISRGSLFENKHWINKTHRLNILTDSEYQESSQLSHILTLKLSSYIIITIKTE